tara:strand:- start:3722 stop:4831 length:1110 start_codon:yes stop_codon:yes gene_type:complete
MPSSSHVSNINHTVLLQALATPGAGFGTVTLLVDEAQGTGNPLKGWTVGPVAVVRYQDFSSADETAAAVAASDITAEVKAFVDVGFMQDKPVEKVRVCRVNTAGGESYADALVALRSEDLTDLWMLCSDLRVPATLVALALAVEAYGGEHFLLVEDDDADWLTAGIPTAWVDVAAYRWSGVAYHDVTTAAAALAIATRNLAFDADVTSVGWEKDVKGVAAYAAFVNTTERKEAIDNNAAVLGTWGSSDYWYDAVRNFEGRPLKEALTAAWYKARVDEAVQTMHQREASFGRAVLVAESGMSQVIGVISGVNATAVNAGHFVPGQVIVTGQPITAADISAQRLRVVVEAQVGTAVRTFTFDSYLSQTAVN